MCVDRKIRRGRVAQLDGSLGYRMPFHVPVPVPVKRHRGSTGKRIWFALGFYHKPLKRPGCGVWAASLLFVVSKCP
jgi:hypothetical protein